MGDAITIWLQGGLGNQLFQLNAGLVAATDARVSLRISRGSFSRDKKRNYELAPMVSDLRHISRVEEAINRPYDREGRLRESAGHPRRMVVNRLDDARPRCLMVGFFQDQQSLRRGVDPVLDRLANVHQSKQAERVQRMVTGRVAVHVRRGDYVALESAMKTFGTMSTEYFLRGIAALGASLDDVIFFTDDLDYVVEAFGVSPDQVVTSSTLDSPLETVIAMGAARGIVIPNSTFSWWASELVRRRGGTVAGPRRWFLDRDHALSPLRSEWIHVDN